MSNESNMAILYCADKMVRMGSVVKDVFSQMYGFCLNAEQ